MLMMRFDLEARLPCLEMPSQLFGSWKRRVLPFRGGCGGGGGGMVERLLECACTTGVEFSESLGNASFPRGGRGVIPSMYHPVLLVAQTLLLSVVLFG